MQQPVQPSIATLQTERILRWLSLTVLVVDMCIGFVGNNWNPWCVSIGEWEMRLDLYIVMRWTAIRGCVFMICIFGTQ